MIHVGDAALNAVLGHFNGIYKPAQEAVAEWLKAYLKKHPPDAKTTFHGRDWIRLRKRIAKELTRANIKATDAINARLYEAFAAGMSEAAYTISKEMWPITAYAVSIMAADGFIVIGRRIVNTARDVRYNEDRVETAVHSAVYNGTKPERMHQVISERLVSVRMREMSSIARAKVYGSADTGAYYAGMEAERMGIETEKTWLSIMDSRVRTSHKALHHTTIPIDELFHGYYGDLRYPHDPEAPPEEVMNCRCRMVIHEKGNAPEEYSREILPSETTAYRKWRDVQILRGRSAIELAKRHERMLKG